MEILNSSNSSDHYHECESRHFRLPVYRVASLRFALVHFDCYVDGSEELHRPYANLTNQTTKQDKTLCNINIQTSTTPHLYLLCGKLLDMNIIGEKN